MGEEIITIYCKATSNYPDGWDLHTFEILSPIWKGERLLLPFGPKGEERILEVVGWTDLFFGSPCPVRVARARSIETGEEAYLVWGGNSGVRVLDPEAKPIPWVDEHLPRGWGMPIIWVEDAADLPEEVRAVVCGGIPIPNR